MTSELHADQAARPASLHGGGSSGHSPAKSPLMSAGLSLLLLLAGCGLGEKNAQATPVESSASTPSGAVAAALMPADAADPSPASMHEDLDAYLASPEPAGRRFALDKLHFVANSATLSPDAQARIADLAEVLVGRPLAMVHVVGYADPGADGSANTQLGAQRADAVAKALVALEVTGDRVTSARASESNPVEAGAPLGRMAVNRPTELVVTGK